MKLLKYCPSTFRILGPTASLTEEFTVEITDELFVRLAFDMDAFEYCPQTDEVQLKPSFEHKPIDEPKAVDIESFVRGILEFTYVPEIDASVTLEGPLGRALLFAISSSIYVPQTIYVKTSSSYTTLEVTEEIAGYICQALKLKVDSTLGENNE